MKKDRLKDIEGSYLDSLNDNLIECVCRNKIIFKPSIKYKKGMIIKAILKNDELELVVSKGYLFQSIMICIIIVFLVIIVGVVY